MTAFGTSPSGKFLARYSVTTGIWFFGTSAPADTMRSTSSFQSAGVCPVSVIRVIAWQAVHAVATISFPFPAGKGLAPWPCAETVEQKSIAVTTLRD